MVKRLKVKKEAFFCNICLEYESVQDNFPPRNRWLPRFEILKERKNFWRQLPMYQMNVQQFDQKREYI